MAMRKWRTRRIREASGALWPILPSAGQKPENWPGWPDGKDFALVLTHDVEGPGGLAQVRELALLEKELGFRSSFNFIPEGSYEVPGELRAWLGENGFEVGVHDLKHDGHLYASRKEFSVKAERISQYLSDWEAVGFRSGFMLRRLEWLHELNISYDASTFDTDPFEPQPEGAHTIFPFLLRPAGPADPPDPCSGYVELPYTLPQDSTLFLVLREKDNRIWREKLDWIARQGGMALLNTHPDYMRMDGQTPGPDHFPVSWYRELLEYVRDRYPDRYWHALPREVARFVTEKNILPAAGFSGSAVHSPGDSLTGKPSRPKIWIDLDNTPHIPFFDPIIRELEKRGYSLLLTARDAFQVLELCGRYQLPVFRVGRHHGKGTLRKGLGLMQRAAQLAEMVISYHPVLALSHGSRAQLLLANALRIPSLLIDDYEHSRYPRGMRPDWMLVPEVIPPDLLPVPPDRVRTYPGIKENVYVTSGQTVTPLPQELGFRPEEILVVARPPATEAHYHEPESETLFAAFMDRAVTTPGVRIVLLPRHPRQKAELESRHPDWFRDRRTVIPGEALDGLNLLRQADLMVSGGGTMNREAAVLGIPVYSLFRGSTGAVDRHLAAEGKLTFITSPEEVAAIPLRKFTRTSASPSPEPSSLVSVVDRIEEIAAAIPAAL